MAGLLSLVPSSVLTGVESVTCVTVRAETLMHRDHGKPPAVAWRLVDGYVLAMSSQRRVLTGIELASPRQRAFHLLHCRVLKQRVDLTMGPTVFGCCGLREPSEQGRHGSYVLACPGEVGEASVILDDPPVYVMGDGACTTTVSAAFNLTLKHHTLLL